MSTYKVTASYGFDDHPEGEEFDADMDEAMQARLINAGLIELVKETKRKETKPDA